MLLLKGEGNSRENSTTLNVSGDGILSQGFASVQRSYARKSAEVITLGAVGAPPLVESVLPPHTPRTYAMVVVLPTGEVAQIGGATLSVEFSDNFAVNEVGECCQFRCSSEAA